MNSPRRNYSQGFPVWLVLGSGYVSKEYYPACRGFAEGAVDVKQLNEHRDALEVSFEAPIK